MGFVWRAPQCLNSYAISRSWCNKDRKCWKLAAKKIIACVRFKRFSIPPRCVILRYRQSHHHHLPSEFCCGNNNRTDLKYQRLQPLSTKKKRSRYVPRLARCFSLIHHSPLSPLSPSAISRLFNEHRFVDVSLFLLSLRSPVRFTGLVAPRRRLLLDPPARSPF